MTQPVVLDASAVARIADTIRAVETGDRRERPLTFAAIPAVQQRRTFRVCTFTGAWAINSPKVVTLKYQTATPNTVVATNLFANVPAPTGSGDCAIGRDGTAWFLVEWFEPTQQTASITVLTGATLTTAGLQFTRAVITVQATATQSVTIVDTTAC